MEDNEMLETMDEIANEIGDLSIDNDVAVESNGIHAFMDAPFNPKNGEGNNKEGQGSNRSEMPINGNMNVEDDFDVPEDVAAEETPQADMYYNNVFNNFRELGLISSDYQLQDGQVLDNDSLIGILEEEKRREARKIFEEEFLSKFNDEDSLDYIEYVLSGGNPRNYLDRRANTQVMNFDGDITDEKFQDKVIKTYLSRFNNASGEEIKDTLEMLNLSNKKEKYAKKYLAEIKQYEAQEKERILKEQEVQEMSRREAANRTYETINNTLSGMSNIFGVRCDDRKRNHIMEMFYKPITLRDGSVTTEFQYRLNAAQRDPRALIILADLLANNLNVNNYNKSIESKITRQIKAGLDGKPKRQKNSPFDSLFK